MSLARVAAPPAAPESMTPAQRERRRRVLDAVIELVSEGAVDDVGMKEIAERSGVALGTIYRYFSSKDHVIAAALVEWARALDRRVAQWPDGDEPMVERLVAILRQGVRAFQREPSFARMMVAAAGSPDPFASEAYRDMGPVVFGTLGRALDGLDSTLSARILRVIGAVWYQSLVDWVNGRITIAQVADDLEDTARLLLEPCTAA